MRKILTALIVALALILYSAPMNATAPTPFKSVEESTLRPFKIMPKPTALVLFPSGPSPKKLLSLVSPTPSPAPKPKPKVSPPPVSKSTWKVDYNISWYGPGFYGRRTACGLELTKTLIGVAHRTLKCGTIITFKWGGVIVHAPVVDRGPYVAGRQFDMTGGLCVKLDHCFTGKIYYRVGK